MGRIYTSNIEDQDTLADNGDFGVLTNGSGVFMFIHEIRIQQRDSPTLAMETIRITRGTAGGTGGTNETTYNYDILNPTAGGVLARLPTVDVSGSDLQLLVGWNLLQEFVWLPTPQMRLHMAISDRIGIGKLGTTSITGFSVQCTWEEFGV